MRRIKWALIILTILSLSLLCYNIFKTSKYSIEIDRINEEIEDFKTKEDNLEDLDSIYNELLEENKEKYEVYQKWIRKTKEISSL